MNSTPQIYHCGQLKYTFRGVCVVIGLLMLSFAFYTLASTTVATVVPLRLKELGASNKMMAMILVTIGQILNITICPAVSFKSDRYRGKRWGRRFYFIISTLPMYGGSIILFGLSGYIGTFIAKLYHGAPATAIIGTIGVAMLIYQFYFMFVGSVIFYVYNDLIPQEKNTAPNECPSPAETI